MTDANDLAAQTVYRDMFNGVWRVTRGQLRQQIPTLRTLFEAAQAAVDSRPKVFHHMPMPGTETDEDVAAFIRSFEQEETAMGARDAYATAIVLFVDGLLRDVLQFYLRLDDVSKTLQFGWNGVSADRIFKYTANNIRHYDGWRRPTHQIDQPKRAYKTVKIIATVLGQEIPAYEYLSVMASNHAWPVVYTVSGGTFEGLIAFLRGFFDELVTNAGMRDDEYILAEVARESSA